MIESVLRYWENVLEMDDISLLGGALKRRSLEKGNSLLIIIKQEFERLDVGNIQRNEEENSRNVWREVGES